MVNYIPFEKLEVGKTYYMQSVYWRKVLGCATIKELYPATGEGWYSCDWGVGEGRFTANEDYMWDDLPTEEELKNRVEEGLDDPYVPPRFLEGEMYSGKIMEERWKNKLDELISNLRTTFDEDPILKDPEIKSIWESNLDYVITDLLVKGTGECDWESISYVEKNGGFDIYAGEKDSFGWLVGVIEDNKSHKKIFYD